MKTKKANSLCCIVNPAYECKLCGAVVCKVCNKVDEEYADDHPGQSINTMGHLLKSCSRSRVPGHGWDDYGEINNEED
jgi:hypothetical protein